MNMSAKLTILFILSWTSSIGLACSFPERTIEEQFRDAERVFSAKIVSTKLKSESLDGQKFEVVNATYALIESFKGNNPKKGVVKELPISPGNCMLGLLTGVRYVFFLEDDGFVTIFSGSWAYSNPEGSEVIQEVEKLRALASENI